MTPIQEPQSNIYYEHRVTLGKIDRPEHSRVYEGEVPMSSQEQDQVHALLGDGNASVTVRRDIGEMSYGNGGRCSVSITIRCNQDTETIKRASHWASYLAESVVYEEHPKMKAQVAALGINP